MKEGFVGLLTVWVVVPITSTVLFGNTQTVGLLNIGFIILSALYAKHRRVV